VAVHSQMVLIPGQKELAVFHMMRFKGDKIVEFWDCAQDVLPDCANRDGMF